MKWFKCTYCGEEKLATEFYKDKHKPSGHKPRCKPCDKKSLNKQRRREYESEYRQKNPERRSAIVKKSMHKNKANHAEVRRRYLLTDAGVSVYRKYTQKRYAVMKQAFVEDVDVKVVYDNQAGICYLCGGNFAFSQMHADHVTPISKGGLHERKNIKMACAYCNLSKGSKLLQEVRHQMV